MIIVDLSYIHGVIIYFFMEDPNLHRVITSALQCTAACTHTIHKDDDIHINPQCYVSARTPYIRLLLYFCLTPPGNGCPSLQNFKGAVKLCDLNQNISSVFPQLCHLTPPLPNGWCMSCGNVQWEVAPITTSDLRSRSCNAIKDGRAWNTNPSPSVKNITPLWCPEALLLCCLSFSGIIENYILFAASVTQWELLCRLKRRIFATGDLSRCSSCLTFPRLSINWKYDLMIPCLEETMQD